MKTRYEPPRIAMPSSSVVAVDTEYAPDGRLMTVAWADATDGTWWDTKDEWATLPEQGTKIQAWTSLIERRPPVLVMHSGANDITAFIREGLHVGRLPEGEGWYDTLILAHLLNENMPSYRLGDLFATFYDAPSWKDLTKDKMHDVRLLDWQERAARCLMDAHATFLLFVKIKEWRHDLPSPTVVRLHHRIALTCHRMGLAGMKVDMDRFASMRSKIESELFALRVTLREQTAALGMPDFVVKDSDIRTLMFDVLKLPVITYTSGGADGTKRLPQVNKEVLKQYAATPVIATISEIKKKTKLLSTWFGGHERKSKLPAMADMIGPDGIIHPFFNAVGTVTGRRSSSKPNFQNFPKKAKEIFMSRWPGGRLITADYKSLEMRLMGWACGDPKLIAYFADGGPGYCGIGRDLFGVEVRKETPEYTQTKSTVLGTGYGMGGKGLARRLWYVQGIRLADTYEEHEKQAIALRKRYLRAFPGLAQYIKLRTLEVQETRQVKVASGRVRRLHQGGATQAINAPIQGLASDIMGLAIVLLEERLCKLVGKTVSEYHEILAKGELARHPMPVLCAEVHDCAVVDAPAEYVEQAEQIIQDVMTRVVPERMRLLCPTFDCTLSVDMKASPYWHQDEQE